MVTLTAELQRRIQVKAMRCYRKINEEVSVKTQQAIRPREGMPAGTTTRRPLDYRIETQTAVVWSCLLFIRSGQNHFARHSEKGKKTKQTEEEVGRFR